MENGTTIIFSKLRTLKVLQIQRPKVSFKSGSRAAFELVREAWVPSGIWPTSTCRELVIRQVASIFTNQLVWIRVLLPFARTSAHAVSRTGAPSQRTLSALGDYNHRQSKIINLVEYPDRPALCQDHR